MKHNFVFDGKKRDEVLRRTLNTAPDPRKSKKNANKRTKKPAKKAMFHEITDQMIVAGVEELWGYDPEDWHAIRSEVVVDIYRAMTQARKNQQKTERDALVAAKSLHQLRESDREGK